VKALLLVDIQNDFLPGGALAVPHGHEILPVVNKLLKKDWKAIVASKDWHPPRHSSFAAHGGPWPEHCVQGTKGAELAPGFDHDAIDYIVLKGIDREHDSYSAFFDNAKKRSTGLHDYLQEEKITDLTIVGLATDYCVKATVLDALDLGYSVTVILEAVRGVNLNPGDSEKALQEMVTRGAQLNPLL
jgi:nicotinamidase/pyrazinamidase